MPWLIYVFGGSKGKQIFFYFPAAGVECRVAAGKCYFYFHKIIEPILIS